MGLTGKILLFIATLVVLLVGGTLAFTTIQANQLARSTIDAGLKETRDVWHTIQDDRFKKLRLGVRVLANDPVLQGGDRRARPEHVARLARRARPGPRRRLHDGDRPRGQADRAHRPPLGHRGRPLEGPDRQEGARGGRRGRALASRRPALHRGRGADADGSRARGRDGRGLPAERSARGADAQDHPQRDGVPGAAGRPAREGGGLVARPARAGARRVARDAADGPGGRSPSSSTSRASATSACAPR